MINKLISKGRTTEVASVSEKLGVAFQNYDLTRDSYLSGTFTTLGDETNLLLEAIKRSKSESVMNVKNLTRADKTRALFYLVKGALYHPEPVVSTAAQEVDKVLEKYGLTEITSESYDIVSSLTNSMMGDLAAAELQASIAAISGCAGVITALQAAQEDFVQAYAAYQQDKAEEGELETASEIKKRVLGIINEQLVVYLRAMVKVDEPGYGGFAATVTQIIDDANENIKRRDKKEETEPAPEEE
jgi:uncharacterized protein (DUF697 family)